MSYVNVQANQDYRIMELPKPISQLLYQEDDEIEREFSVIDTISPQKVVINQFPEKDVYSNIWPFEETAIVRTNRFSNLAVKTNSSYINASRIRSIYQEPMDDNKLIATQAPKDNTVEDFWEMIVQERVSIIVCLIEEEGIEKGECYQYFPQNIKQDEDLNTISYGKYDVVLKKEDNYSH